MKIASIAVIMPLVFFWGATATPAQQRQSPPSGQPDQKVLFEEFEQTLSGAVMVGQFMILGKEGPLRREEYTIKSVRKLPEGDFWLFQARIKYGDKDITLPLPLNVKWAGDTPVITLTDLNIPGLGTCGARVVIHNDMYAGTWTHGNASGHMFGVIKKIEDTPGGDASSKPKPRD